MRTVEPAEVPDEAVSAFLAAMQRFRYAQSGRREWTSTTGYEDRFARHMLAAAIPAILTWAEYLEDLAAEAAVLESQADPRPGVPWEQVKAENGL
jgi:hypothetical protein